MAYVLVVGLAGASGMVSGDTTESDITITVQDLHVDLWDMWINTTSGGTSQTYRIIEDGGDGDDLGAEVTEVTEYEIDDIDVRVRVQADSVSNLEEVRLWLNESTNTGDTVSDGDAQAQFDETWTPTTDTSEKNFTAKFEDTYDNYNFLRYGAWDIEADAYNDTHYEKDTRLPGFDAALHQIVENAQSVSATGAPGDNLQTNESDFDPGNPIIEVTSNANWSLSPIEDDITLEGPGGEITGSDTYGNYSHTADPTDTSDLIAGKVQSPHNVTASDNHYLVYDIDIPTIEPGTYEQTIIHNLNNEDG